MLARRWIVYSCSTIAAVLLAGGIYRAHRPGAIEATSPSTVGKDARAAAPSANRARIAELSALNRLAWAAAHVRRTPGDLAGAAPDNGRAVLDEAAKGERELMAAVWGFTDDQRRKFEEAASKPKLERAAVYQRLQSGQLSKEDFLKELAAADERDSAELCAILGSHY